MATESEVGAKEGRGGSVCFPPFTMPQGCLGLPPPSPPPSEPAQRLGNEHGGREGLAHTTNHCGRRRRRGTFTTRAVHMFSLSCFSWRWRLAAVWLPAFRQTQLLLFHLMMETLFECVFSTLSVYQTKKMGKSSLFFFFFFVPYYSCVCVEP